MNLRDPSEVIVKCWFAAQSFKTIWIIINNI